MHWTQPIVLAPSLAAQAAALAAGRPQPAPQAASRATPAGRASPAAAAARPPRQPTPRLPPQGLHLQPEGRRDPFVSLLRRGSDVGQRAPGRAAGGPEGTRRRRGDAARAPWPARAATSPSCRAPTRKTYIVRPGEQLADGTIRSITADALVILQQVNDPLSLEKQREVRKVLRQTEEASAMREVSGVPVARRVRAGRATARGAPLGAAGVDVGRRSKQMASRLDARTGVLTIEASDPVPYVASQPDPRTFVVELRDVVAAAVSHPVSRPTRAARSRRSWWRTRSRPTAPAWRACNVTLSQPARPRVRSSRNVIFVEADRLDTGGASGQSVAAPAARPSSSDVRVHARAAPRPR